MWLPLSLLGGRVAHGYLARVEDVRRRGVVLNLGRLRAKVPAGDLHEKPEEVERWGR